MNSPLVRAILSLLGAYVLLMLVLVARDWFREEYPTRPPAPEKIEKIQHPYHHQQALQAMADFKKLPQPEQDRIRTGLDSNLIPVEEWVQGLNQSEYHVICLGEAHEESTRSFLAEEIFVKLDLDVFLLEATPRELERIYKRLDSGRDYFPLLGADLLAVLRAVKARNPNIKIHGIEQTDQQARDQAGLSGARDQAIAANFWDKQEPGRRNVILFGALHCADETNWLYSNLRSPAPSAMRDRMLNACVLGEHQSGPLEAFIFFLDNLGIPKKDFVISDTKALPPKIYELFQPLKHQLLDKYSVHGGFPGIGWVLLTFTCLV